MVFTIRYTCKRNQPCAFQRGPWSGRKSFHYGLTGKLAKMEAGQCQKDVSFKSPHNPHDSSDRSNRILLLLVCGRDNTPS